MMPMHEGTSVQDLDVDEMVAVSRFNPATNRREVIWLSETQDPAPPTKTALAGTGTANPDPSVATQVQSTSRYGGTAADTAVDGAAHPGADASSGIQQGQASPQDNRTTANTAADRNGAANRDGLQIPSGISALFSKPPLLASEDRDQYYELVAFIANEVGPTTGFEWFWIKDYVDLTFEIVRWRRARVEIIDAARERVAEELVRTLNEGIRPDMPDFEIYREAWHFKRGAKLRLLEQPQLVGLDDDSIDARAIELCCADLVRIDAMLVLAERRRQRRAGGYRTIIAWHWPISCADFR